MLQVDLWLIEPMESIQLSDAAVFKVGEVDFYPKEAAEDLSHLEVELATAALNDFLLKICHSPHPWIYPRQPLLYLKVIFNYFVMCAWWLTGWPQWPKGFAEHWHEPGIH